MAHANSAPHECTGIHRRRDASADYLEELRTRPRFGSGPLFGGWAAPLRPLGLSRTQLRHAQWLTLGVAVVLLMLCLWLVELCCMEPAEAVVRIERPGPSSSSALEREGAVRLGSLRGRLMRKGPQDTDVSEAVEAMPHMESQEVGFNASKLEALDHLVLVAGHAVVLAEALNEVDSHDKAWYLEQYQRDQDLPGALVGHIRSGVEAAAADPSALLIFSGGQTRPDAGPRDEGYSYYRVAEHYNWWGHTTRRPSVKGRKDEDLNVIQRTIIEDFAADSYQNLLFSLCRFKEVVGRYPTRVTVVSFEFKRRRFEDLHRAAIRFPRENFNFVGVQPPSNSRFDLAKAERGERDFAARSFEGDPYGCHTEALVAKRSARNPFRRTTPYPLSCSDIRPLLEWCGPALYPRPLPWSGHA